MAESTEIEEQVELEEDNYMKEMDDDVKEQVEDDAEEEGGDGNLEENDEVEEYDYSKAGIVRKIIASKKDQSPKANRNGNDIEHLEYDKKLSASSSEDEKEKHAQLLSLLHNGSEVFIGGLHKDASKEDLRDLCEPISDVFEVRLIKDKDGRESKDKLKDAADKEEKAKKFVGVNEFLKPAEGERSYNPSSRGHGQGHGSKGGYGGNMPNNVAAPSIKDLGQFPSLGGK